MTIVRLSTMDDVKYLSTRLKKSDIDEIYASHRQTPAEALKLSMENSTMCYTVEKDKETVAMFGCSAETILSDRAVIWFLSSEKIRFMKISFLRKSKDFVNLMLKNYSLLYNFVDLRNKLSINWLESIGAKFGTVTKINDHPFQTFWFERTI